MTTLAAHMAATGIRRIDILKIDVEGAELEVLAGLGDRIGDVGVIVGELHEKVVDAAEVYGFLKDAGFRRVLRQEGWRFLVSVSAEARAAWLRTSGQ